MRMTLALVLLLLASGVGAVDVDVFMNGNQLYQYCNEKNPEPQMYCFGYVAGVADTIGHNVVNGFRACIPKQGTTQGQIRDIVVKFLTDHPEWRHGEAPGLIANALSDAFPCPKK